MLLAGPTDFDRCVHRYRAFGTDEANRLDEAGVLQFARVFPEGRFLVRVAGTGGLAAPAARVTILGTSEPGPAIRRRVRDEVRWRLGGAFDLRPFYRRARRDPVLAQLVRRFRGYRPPLVTDPFESLVTSISAQQINLAFAATTRSRLVRAYGPAVQTPQGERFHAFPRPEDLARVREPRLRAMQFSGTKTRAILGLARAAGRGEVPLDDLSGWDDARIQECLTAQFGIGRWTVDWFLSRALGRPDAWPAGDLGVRKAVSWYYFKRNDQSEDRVREFGERFGEHRNLAAHYLLVGWATERREARAAMK
ncbi:MAG: hypothetical protein Q8R92_05715 [Deltaproteobacteria bacterium]|nr:hypothetical protein [Deltaproteobacteria bacterium]